MYVLSLILLIIVVAENCYGDISSMFLLLPVKALRTVVVYSAAKSNAKKVSLELGGKSPLIIFSDCDIDRAVRYVSRLHALLYLRFITESCSYDQICVKRCAFVARC